MRELQAHGIRVLGSSIVGLPEHTPETIDEAIEHAVAHDTEFHQFMLYTPVPGTPLYAEQLARGTLLDEAECPPADAHGQLRFNFRHPHIRDGQETEYLLRAFRRDYEVNGPSVLRIARTLLQGWARHRCDPDPRVRARYALESRGLATGYAGALWAAERWLADQPSLADKARALRIALVDAFGVRARLAAPVVGRVVLAAMHREQGRLEAGLTCEPPTFYETNPAAAALGQDRRPAAVPCRSVALAPAAAFARSSGAYAEPTPYGGYRGVGAPAASTPATLISTTRPVRP